MQRRSACWWYHVSDDPPLRVSVPAPFGFKKCAFRSFVAPARQRSRARPRKSGWGWTSRELRCQEACGCPKPCRGWSCGSSVFVDEVSAACRSDNSNLLMAVGVWRLCRRWRPLIERPVVSVGVVVVDVVEHEPLKLALRTCAGSGSAVARLGASRIGFDTHRSDGGPRWRRTLRVYAS